MGTISERTRRNGAKSYTAQIRIRREGRIVHSEAQTFQRYRVASAWLKKRETELAEPGALEALHAPGVTLDDVIEKYLQTERRGVGRSKAQVLETIRKHPLSLMRCEKITSVEICAFAEDLLEGWVPDGREARPRKPQTVGNYLSHLGSVFAIARPMWGYPLDRAAFQDAFTVNKRMGVVKASDRRDRRPSLEELDALLSHFAERAKHLPQAIPMHQVILFALFSTRRQEEITRITWADYHPKDRRVLVRDMKNPSQKKGNHVWCDLPPPAMAVIEAMPRQDERIFPFQGDAISAAFTRACKLLGIVDLHFHDLRHEGVSLLFEQGLTIPVVATVSGHRSWTSLQRYAHIRAGADKYAGWRWMPQLMAADCRAGSV